MRDAKITSLFNPETMARRLVREWLDENNNPYFPSSVMEDLVRKITRLIQQERRP